MDPNPWHHGGIVSDRQSRYERAIAQHKDAVYRQIVRVCGNYDDAQDVLVETLLAAYRAMDQVRDPDAFRGWLATIGRRICRRMKQREALSPIFELLPEDEPATFHEPEVELERQRMTDCVKSALEALPPNYREAYLLRDVDGMSTEEAATKLGITERNLKSRLHRARKKVRETLDLQLCAAE